MTPERRAQVIQFLRMEEKIAVTPYYIEACRDAADALESMGEAPKSAEASMKERIEGLEDFVGRIAAAPHSSVAGRFKAEAEALLHGPSDPDRDRETQAEQVRP